MVSPASSGQGPTPGSRRRFETTHWSVVLAAKERIGPESRRALASLCQAYWYPVYAYVCSRGFAAPDAEDLTQGFFTRLLEKETIRGATPDRGRFRSFLLASVKNYLSNEWDRATAAKRGGGRAPLSLDFAAAESRYPLPPASGKRPDAVFVQQWTRTLLAETLAELEEEMCSKGEGRRFEALADLLTGAEGGDYREAALKLGLREGAARVAVHRMRRRFGELLRRRVADTVASPDELEAEISFLLAAAGA